MPSPCLLEIEFRVNEEKRRELSQSISSLRSARAPGRIQTLVYAEMAEPDRYIWVEEWSDEGKLEHYLTTNSFRAVMGGLRVLGTVLRYRIVEIEETLPKEGRLEQPGRSQGRLLSFDE
jgi:quinol monooxygenase YgiN